MVMTANYPKPPVQPIPSWATSGAKVDPGTTKRANGWTYNVSTGFGEYPTMEWVNFESWNVGVWQKYFIDVCAYFQNQFATGQMGSSFFCATPSSDVSIPLVGSAGTLAYQSVVTGTTILKNTNLNIFTGGTTFSPPINGIYEIECDLAFKIAWPSDLGDDMGSPTVYLKSSYDGIIRVQQLAGKYLFFSSDIRNFPTVYMNVSAKWLAKLNVGQTSIIQLAAQSDASNPTYVTLSLLAANSYLKYSWNNSQPYYNP